MKPHIKYLLEMEEKSNVGLMWGRNSHNNIWISTIGCNHREHWAIEEHLLKLGCRYSFGDDKCLQKFDKTNGRTLTVLVEPSMDEWICPQCGEPNEMSIDDVDAPCQDCAEGNADALYDAWKDSQYE